MAYLVLARKYRPQTFEEIYAQDHITQILKNTIDLDRTAHAYLFTGPRGVGKTSLARIFAKSLNCLENGPTTHPCNKCQNCTEITSGISADVIEIDGASNTGVEDIRELQKELMYSPSNSLYKIYIIDEVHMLSKNAFNALLKTLEEPPKNVIFIFATTEPHKVIATIISRCQRFDFKRIPIPDIISRLQEICELENISIDKEALFMVAKKADGSMRDAQSLMDQVLAYGKEHIALTDVLSIFGIVHFDIFHKIMEFIAQEDATSIIKLLHDVLEKGNDIQEFINGLLDYIRNLLLVKVNIEVPTMSDAILKEMQELTSNFSENDLLYLMSILVKAKMDIKSSTNPILVTEMTFIKIAKLQKLQALDDILNNLGNFESEPVAQIKREKPKQPKPSREEISKKTEEVKHVMEKEIDEDRPNVDSLSEEVYKKYLPQIIRLIKKEKPMVGTYLEKSQLESIQNNVINYSVSKQMAYNYLMDGKNIISDIFSNFFKLRIKVHFDHKEKEKSDEIVNPTLEDIRRESPIIADFIEKTDSIFD
ncbi:MAG: DNA polymerase III subunit gamma/tau [Candidatus Cloacimonetes bacterium]|nr:DNA polymerase III subunit gamma/tau [Candidatus Cloacimonadota bacterium]MCF7867368.1 DNA polymerase III subunit gamma/tau [Candidatus Cloacimonadota bacterium]MCF7882802.1 DNA polymerase III subunit gamma/tau [Candidatus Cloacimonadota bacterium]